MFLILMSLVAISLYFTTAYIRIELLELNFKSLLFENIVCFLFFVFVPPPLSLSNAIFLIWYLEHSHFIVLSIQMFILHLIIML